MKAKVNYGPLQRLWWIQEAPKHQHQLCRSRQDNKLSQLIFLYNQKASWCNNNKRASTNMINKLNVCDYSIVHKWWLFFVNIIACHTLSNISVLSDKIKMIIITLAVSQIYSGLHYLKSVQTFLPQPSHSSPHETRKHYTVYHGMHFSQILLDSLENIPPTMGENAVGNIIKNLSWKQLNLNILNL